MNPSNIRFGALAFIPVVKTKKEADATPGTIREKDLEDLAMQVSNEAQADVQVAYQKLTGKRFWHRKGQEGSPVVTHPLSSRMATVNAVTRMDDHRLFQIDLPDAEGKMESYLKQRGVHVVRTPGNAPV